MSEPELAYMPGNDDFDLPRWQTHQFHDTLSSSAQAAQAAQQASFSPSYGAAPPAQSMSTTASNRQPPVINTHLTGPQGPESARPPRISQLYESEQLGNNYLSSGQSHLSRSASLGGGSAGSAGIGSGSFMARRNRHHMQEDLESAYMEGTQGPQNDRPQPQQQQQHWSMATSQQIPQSFYPASVPYSNNNQQQQQSQPSTASLNSAGSTMVTDPYPDSQYSSSSHLQPRRSQTKLEDPPSARSPRRAQTGQMPTTPLLDPYSQQQQSSQTPASGYSPTSTVYSQYPTPNEMPSASPYYQHSSQASSHAQVQVKREPSASPMASPFGGQRTLPPPPTQGSSQYSGPHPMDTASPGPSHSPLSASHHLSSHSQSALSLRQTVSTPNTPFSYHSQQNHQIYPTSADDTGMAVESSPHKRRTPGFKRVRDSRDLRPYMNTQPAGRRQDPNGQFLSPLRQLTTGITDTYHICNPQFRYESTHNPRRVLTKPSKAAHNDGYDNVDYDYILYVNDWLGNEKNKYLILDVLGQGTFGQVVKCQNIATHEIVAVKVVKNKPAYFNQSMMEVTILELLNNQCDPHDEHHILRLRDSFIHRNHLCLVFELLSSNLYELIKQNQFQGLSTQLVKVFTAQLLDALSVLKDARLIHCDLKPENILLKSLQSPTIKVIDFGSACHERQTVYTYIQSRFYRSPEVLLGISYNSSIDMWSLGCIAVELFLGLPLFPGTSEYNQITRIVEMLGLPPVYMLEVGKQAGHFFDSYLDHYGQKKYRLKSIEQYSRERNVDEQPGKQYFKATSLPEIINNAPMPNFKSSSKASAHELEKAELMNRAAFIDFCQGLLNLDPLYRWTPQQARLHPFITGEKFTKPFVPPNASHAAQPSAPTTDPKRPYGGLVPSQPKGQRAYQDAATYNQHLAQHQAYTAQAQAASQQSSAYRNPYVASQAQQQPQVSASVGPLRQDYTVSQNLQPTSSSVPALAQQSSTVAALNLPSNLAPNPPSNAYYPNSRARANTINNNSVNLDTIPPALARLQHMNHDVISGRNALTPVLNRDDAMREWERRQSGKAPASQPYPQLEFLQQQAEMAASGLGPWNQPRRFQAQPSSLSQTYQPSSSIVVDEPERRDAIMSNVRSAARGEQHPSQSLYNSATAASLSSPPQAYSGGSTGGAARFGGSFSQQQPTSSFDGVDRRGDMNAYAPMQPDQYQSYPTSPSHQSGSTSFYSAGIVPTGSQANTTQRNPFSGQNSGTNGQNNVQRDGQRTDGMGVWAR